MLLLQLNLQVSNPVIPAKARTSARFEKVEAVTSGFKPTVSIKGNFRGN